MENTKENINSIRREYNNEKQNNKSSVVNVNMNYGILSNFDLNPILNKLHDELYQCVRVC